MEVTTFVGQSRNMNQNMKKKNIIQTVIAALILTACQQTQQAPISFTVEGTLPDSTHHGEQIYLQRYSDGMCLGITKIESDRFTFTGVADSAVYCRIDIDKNLYSNLIVENGNIQVKMDYTNLLQTPSFATGTPGNEEFARIRQLEEDILSTHSKRIDSLRQIYSNEQEFITLYE